MLRERLRVYICCVAVHEYVTTLSPGPCIGLLLIFIFVLTFSFLKRKNIRSKSR